MITDVELDRLAKHASDWRYRSRSGAWDTVRYMQGIRDFNCLPLDNFSPDLLDDPASFVGRRHITSNL